VPRGIEGDDHATVAQEDETERDEGAGGEPEHHVCAHGERVGLVEGRDDGDVAD